MRRKRRSLPGEFKAKVALAALRGDLTLNEVAAKYEVHASQVSTWKQYLLEGAKEFFSDRRERRERQDEELVARLYQEIGQLKMELDWLKKSRRLRVRRSGCSWSRPIPVCRSASSASCWICQGLRVTSGRLRRTPTTIFSCGYWTSSTRGRRSTESSG